MVEGIKLAFDGVDKDGENLGMHRAVLQVTQADDGVTNLIEFTLEDGSTWMCDLNAFDRALDYAKAEERATRGTENGGER